MNNTSKNILLALAFALTLGTVAATAQSQAAGDHAARAANLASGAAGAASQAGAASAVAGLQTGSAVAAVPLWMSGAVVTAAGHSAVATGTGALHAAGDLAEFARTPAPAAKPPAAPRPALNRQRAVPPSKRPDLPPGETLRSASR